MLNHKTIFGQYENAASLELGEEANMGAARTGHQVFGS
jgi:hypothetical protein